MKRINLGLEWFLNPDHLPFLVGLELGWFKEVGIDLNLVAPDEHLDAFALLEKGQLDLAITEPIHLVEDAAKGNDVVGLARFLHTNGGVMTLASSDIERPRDMAGKRVQYPGAPGPGGAAIVRTMIEADGGDGDADLVPINRGFHHTDALLDNAADVATLAFYNFECIEAKERGHPARLFALKDWGVPDFCQLILIGLRARLDKEGETWRALLQVMSRGLDFIHQQPDRARAIYFARTETKDDNAMMNAIYRATVPCFTFDLDMSDRYYSELTTWMTERGIIERPPATSPWSRALL